ncbi:hypothetical protein [Paractinoplanes rishiriensis]|uniref:Uncharacterized protein n=1 Tax=Paractinoplanes rishiriensis TaxID=1050105 RepID=A0A919JVA2_9ACTN|nr:hypothetical protein [Actinoplanes rishiriensis]GIE94067.1 hypothetical protein Ari01nite_15320 [Actinoplanes rishiriensis]
MLPKLFALTRKTDNEAESVVGYGMVLPDGSAHSVSWPAQAGTSVYSTNSAEETAELRQADLLWLGDPT